MSDRERSESRSGSNHSGVNNSREDKKSKSRSRSREPSKSNHKSRRSRSRSPRKMSYKGSRYRSRSRSPRRRSRRSYSRSRSRSYTPRSKRRSSSHSPMSSRRRHLGSRENPQPCRCLGIFGLSVYTTEQDLHHVFSKYGPVERVQVVIDAKTGRSRGFAFCYFENLEDAKVAKEQCSGMEMDGRHIRVDYSITPRAHTPTPGIYMGKPTYGRDRDYNRYDRRDRDDYYGGYRSSYRRSPSPYYRRSRRYDRSRSRSYSPRRKTNEGLKGEVRNKRQQEYVAKISDVIRKRIAFYGHLTRMNPKRLTNQIFRHFLQRSSERPERDRDNSRRPEPKRYPEKESERNEFPGKARVKNRKDRREKAAKEKKTGRGERKKKKE